MNKTLLPELIERIGQTAVAKGLDVSAPAIAKAVKAGRVIFVTENDDGTMSGEEIRPFPTRPVLRRAVARREELCVTWHCARSDQV